MNPDALRTITKVYIFLPGESEHSLGLGRGVIRLCKLVQVHGTLSAASKEMGMANSKAWRIVKNAEDTLGFSLFIRKGSRGSKLTPQALELIALFDEVEAKTNAFATELVHKLAHQAQARGVWETDGTNG